MMAPPRLVAWVSLTGCWLSGCSLEPHYTRPAASVPPSFPSGPAYPSPPRTPPMPATALLWQKFYTDGKLRAVIGSALANNMDLRVALANIVAAQAEYRVQRSDLLPTVDVGTGATYDRSYVGATPSRGSASGGTTSPYANSQLFTTSVGFTSYELDFFGRIRSLAHASLETYLATEAARRDTQITLIADVATDYMTLAADRAALAAYQDNLVSSRQSMQVTLGRFNAGIGSQLDVSEADTQVETARANVASATTLVATDLNALTLVVGAPIPDALLPDASFSQTLVMPSLPVALASGVLLNRPDVVEAEHTLKSANANIGAARAAFFPAISMTASGGTTSAAFAQLFKGSSAVWSFAPSLSIPIFDGGANQANLDYDKAERTVDVAKYQQTIQTAFREVADALARRGTIDEEVSADRALVAAADSSLFLSTARFRRGTDTYLNVLIAQRTLYTAQQTLIAGQLARSSNLVTLYKALGGGVEPLGYPPRA